MNKKEYAIYENDGNEELIFSGTIDDVAKYLGKSKGYVYSYVSKLESGVIKERRGGNIVCLGEL
ncbi:MAG: hypothetical protein ACK5K7_07515 [Bacilli bacterium]